MSFNYGFFFGAALGALAITFILASIANRFLKRPLFAGILAGLLATVLAYTVGRIRDPAFLAMYWVSAAISVLILRSRARKAEAVSSQDR